jgi:hypothetical protein
LPEGAHLAATLSFRLAGLGFRFGGAPGGGRERWRLKGAAEDAEQPQPPNGDGAGVGGVKKAARPHAQGAQAAWFVRLKPEHGAGRTARSAAIWQEFEGA